MRHVSIAMIAEHAGRQPAAVRRDLKATKVQLERLPGSLGLRVSEKDANTVICKRWPDAGPTPVSLRSILASRLMMNEDNVRALRDRVTDLETCETKNMIGVLRARAEHLALHSLVTELLRRVGIPAAKVAEHYQARVDHFLDQMLSEAEQENPGLGAELDDREPDMIPTTDGHLPLFSNG